MIKVFKFRLYPTDAQTALMDKHMNCCRFIYNLALETKSYAYQTHRVNLSNYDLQKQMTELRKDHDWLKEVSYDALAASMSTLDLAFNNFFARRSKFPKFKNKNSNQSFSLRYNCNIKGNTLFIQKFREGIKIVNHRNLAGDIRHVVVSKSKTNKYFASLIVDDSSLPVAKKPVNIDTTIGLDLGLKTFAVLSDGIEIENPKHLQQSLQRLKVLHRRLSRKKKGSKNRKNAILKLSKLYEKINNSRYHFLHTVSHEITNHYDTICLEDLNISGMVKNHKLALAISSASWSSFVNMLKYKADWRGKNIIQIGIFEASTKTCSNCGGIKDMPLSERHYKCACGLSLSRDHNAAINIKKSGMKRAGELVELSALAGAKKQELF